MLKMEQFNSTVLPKLSKYLDRIKTLEMTIGSGNFKDIAGRTAALRMNSNLLYEVRCQLVDSEEALYASERSLLLKSRQDEKAVFARFKQFKVCVEKEWIESHGIGLFGAIYSKVQGYLPVFRMIETSITPLCLELLEWLQLGTNPRTHIFSVSSYCESVQKEPYSCFNAVKRAVEDLECFKKLGPEEPEEFEVASGKLYAIANELMSGKMREFYQEVQQLYALEEELFQVASSIKVQRRSIKETGNRLGQMEQELYGKGNPIFKVLERGVRSCFVLKSSGYRVPNRLVEEFNETAFVNIDIIVDETPREKEISQDDVQANMLEAKEKLIALFRKEEICFAVDSLFFKRIVVVYAGLICKGESTRLKSAFESIVIRIGRRMHCLSLLSDFDRQLIDLRKSCEQRQAIIKKGLLLKCTRIEQLIERNNFLAKYWMKMALSRIAPYTKPKNSLDILCSRKRLGYRTVLGHSEDKGEDFSAAEKNPRILTGVVGRGLLDKMGEIKVILVLFFLQTVESF